MQKLIISLLCLSVQIQGFTIVKIGAKEVQGEVREKYGHLGQWRIHHNFSLQKDREYIEFTTKLKFTTLEFKLPVSIQIALKGISDLDSPYTIFIIDTDACPATVTWYVDKDGVLNKQYNGDGKLQERIESLLKSKSKGASSLEEERKTSNPPGGPAID